MADHPFWGEDRAEYGAILPPEPRVHCTGCGSASCAGCGRELDPPRFCPLCGRRLTVYVTPGSMRSQCRDHGDIGA